MFLIEELWLDAMENHHAMGYTPIGVVLTEVAAVRIVAEAGVAVGTGWPIFEGKTMPRKRYSKLPVLG